MIYLFPNKKKEPTLIEQVTYCSKVVLEQSQIIEKTLNKLSDDHHDIIESLKLIQLSVSLQKDLILRLQEIK